MNWGRGQYIVPQIAQTYQQPRPYFPHGPQSQQYGFQSTGYHHHTPRPAPPPPPDPAVQVTHLNELAVQEIAKVDITPEELGKKDQFRRELEAVCQEAFAKKYTNNEATLRLTSFGSLASGFATAGSDMDLAIEIEWTDASRVGDFPIDEDIPRLLERAVLDAKMGGRLLSRTRVPILKVCQHPTEQLYHALSDERKKWEESPDGEQNPALATAIDPPEAAETPSLMTADAFPTLQQSISNTSVARSVQTTSNSAPVTDNTATIPKPADKEGVKDLKNANGQPKPEERRQQTPRTRTRERKAGPLDFPKTGEVGIQCDINFENPLAIQNTTLLRCYSRCDTRVRPMVLFVKAWAKRRKINSAYSGTLSSYGWVLMVLHYLVNVANPQVCPNLQSAWRPNTTKAEDLQDILKQSTVGGWTVRFWRNEEQIAEAALNNILTNNTESLGSLLRGFFEYYASNSRPSHPGQKSSCFYWATEVLSLRTPGGIRLKTEKGWTKAKTVVSNGKEVRQRYLFSIEDPFELEHNVARTVTHDGIVAVRDELRRAWRILGQIGRGQRPEAGLFDELIEFVPSPTQDTLDPQLAQPATAGAESMENGLQDGSSSQEAKGQAI